MNTGIESLRTHVSELRASLAALLPSDQTFVGYLFWLSRPRFWFYLAGPLVVGVVYGASSVTEFVTPLTVSLFAYFLVPANVFLYGVNDIFDADIDSLNPKKAADGREVRFTGDRPVILAVVVATAAGLVFVPALSRPARVAFGGFYLLGAAYSVPPLRLKTTPFLDSASNGLYVLPGVVGYAALSGSAPPLLAVAGGWVWSMGMHTFSAVPDIEPDREAGIHTTATVLGERPTLAYCAGCWVLAAACFASVHPLLGAPLTVYPLFIGVIAFADIDVARAYWWFPIVNTVVGAVLTMGGIWEVRFG